MLLRVQIIATGEYIYLAKDGTLAMQINSTIFNGQDDFLGSKTFPGTTLLEPNNAIFKNAHLILSDPALRTFRIRVWLGALPWKEADFKFTIDHGQVEYVIYIDASLIVNQLTSVSLPGLSDPLRSDQLHFDTVDEFRAYMLATVTAAPGTYPMVFFTYKNEVAFKTIDPGSYGDYPDIAFPVNPYFNAWQIDDLGNGSFIVDDGAPWKENQTPFFTLPYILKRIALFLGYKPIGKWLDEETSNRIVETSMISIDSPFIIADYFHFMPDIPLDEYLKGKRALHGLIIDFNELDKVCIIESLKNLEETADTVDLRPMQKSGRRETGTTADAYTITMPVEDKDQAYTDTEKANPSKLVIGSLATAIQVTDVQLLSVCTKMITEDAPAAAASSTWRVPNIKMPVFGRTPFDQISTLAFADINKFKSRELYFHGLKEDAAGYLYPYGSSDNLDFAGHPLTAFTLALDNTAGSFSAVKHYWQFNKDSLPFEMDFELNGQQVIDVKANKRYLVYDDNMATVSCIFDQMGADLANKDLVDAKLTLWPINKLDNLVEVVPPEDVPPVEPPYDNGLVYARIDIRNITEFDEEFPSPHFGHKQDIYAEFFEDSAGTIPKDVIDLPVRFKQTQTEDGDIDGRIFTFVTVSSTSAAGEIELAHQALQSNTTGGHSYDYEYALMPSAKYTIIA